MQAQLWKNKLKPLKTNLNKIKGAHIRSRVQWLEEG